MPLHQRLHFLARSKYMKASDFLCVFAMKEEAGGLFGHVEHVIAGLGKVNATYHLTKKLSELKAQGKSPKAIINFGTAGSSHFNKETVVECTTLVQRDMDVTPLGFELGTTPFEENGGDIRIEPHFEKLVKGVCGTGDSFDISGKKQRWTVVDMEAYALAKVSRNEEIPFVCVKYVTDGADGAAHTDWSENLPFAAKAFRALFDEIAK